MGKLFVIFVFTLFAFGFLESTHQLNEPYLSLDVPQTYTSSTVNYEYVGYGGHKMVPIGDVHSKVLTAKIVSPVVLKASEIAGVAGTLPTLFAAKGALLGEAIAKPIIAKSVATSALVSGTAGCLVAIPFAFKDGLKYIAIETKENIDEHVALWEQKVEKLKAEAKHALLKMKFKTVAVGHILFKPVAIVGAGKGVIAGGAMKGVGVGVKAIGDKLSSIGSVITGAGAALKAKSKGVLASKFQKWKLIKAREDDYSVEVPIVEIVPDQGSYNSAYGYAASNIPPADQLPVNETAIESRPKRNTGDEEKIEFLELLKLVDSLNLRDCVLQVICDLNCDPEAFGNSGKLVYHSLLRFQASGAADGEESKIYKDAAMKGRVLRRPPKDCGKCATYYTACKSKPVDLIKVASKIKLN